MDGGTAERAHARAHYPLPSPNPRFSPHQWEWTDLKTSSSVIIMFSNLFKM